VYKPGLARVEWADIPLAVEDIARIEVIRGPNSAAYGANSYLGTINIMTKHPQSEKGVTVKVTGGMRDVKNTYVNIAESIGTTEVRWTLGSKQKSGFDVLADGETENRDGIEATYSTLSTYTPITSHLNMEWQAGYKTGVNEQRALETSDVIYLSEEDIEAEDIYLWTKLNYEHSDKQFSHVQVYSQHFDRIIEWRACFASAPNYCGDVNKNLTEMKSEIEFQHTSLWNDTLKTVAGLRVRLDQFESETYNDGYSENLNKSGFINAEYKLFDSIILNAGGMYEKDSLNGEYFSPRLASNFQLSNTDVIRLIYSEGTRAPDLFEQNGRLEFTFRNFTIDGVPAEDFIYPVGTAETDLDYEKVVSKEISYFGLYPSINSQLDLKLFYDDLSGLISEALNHQVPLTNRNKLRQQGIEGQFKVKLSEQDDVVLSFSYVDTEDDFFVNMNTADDVAATGLLDAADIGVTLSKGAQRETSLSADRSGSLSWIHSFNTNTVLGTAYYHVENWNPYADAEYNGTGDVSGYTFSRLDMNIRHKIPLTGDLALTLQAAMQYRFDDDPLGRSRNNYVDDHFLYGSAQVNF